MEQTFLPLPAGHSALQAEEGAARESYDSDESPWLEDEEELEQIAEVVGDDPEQEADLVGHIGIRRAGHYLPVIVATAAFVHQGGPSRCRVSAGLRRCEMYNSAQPTSMP